MKKAIILSLLFGLLSLSLYAQINEAKSKMSQGTQPCFMVTLENTDAENVEDSWIDYQKNFKGKTKKDKKAGEVFSDDSRIEDISDNTVDIYSTVSQKGDDTKLSVWFDLGGVYLSSASHPAPSNKAVSFLQEFRKSYQRERLDEEVDTKEDVIKDLEKEIKDIDKDTESLSKDIKKMEEQIKEYQNKIKENEKLKNEKENSLKNEEKALKSLKSNIKELKK